MLQSQQMESVTSADFVRRFGRWQDQVATGPLVVTHHGRARLVAVSMERYQALTEGEEIAGDDGHDVRLATLVERMDEGFIAFDAQLHFVDANPVACAHLRTSAAALRGQALGEAQADFFRTLAHSHLLRAARSGEAAAFDAPSLAYPGNWLRFRTFPYGSGAACLFRNVTEEKEARRRAQAETALAAAIEAHGVIGYARISPRATFLDVDRPLAALAGFDPASLRGVRLTDIMPLNRRVAAACEIEAVLTDGGARAFDGALMVNRGDEIEVRISLASIDGTPANDGAVVVVTLR
ncbi:MAG TPA: PAS domain-containing protein [Sphingomonadaceae bacterium]|nr:PAS domain-containing protein [Sphingomonadaceae bacterium]